MAKGVKVMQIYVPMSQCAVAPAVLQVDHTDWARLEEELAKNGSDRS